MANPVAWHYPNGKPDQCTTDQQYAEKGEHPWTPMYYKHEWIGLTDEEREGLTAHAAEVLLKKKNT